MSIVTSGGVVAAVEGAAAVADATTRARPAAIRRSPSMDLMFPERWAANPRFAPFAGRTPGYCVRAVVGRPPKNRRHLMIILGVVLLILGALLHVSILWTLGIIAIVVGAILWIAGAMGHSIGPRAHYW
jgi:hypothetical protein